MLIIMIVDDDNDDSSVRQCLSPAPESPVNQMVQPRKPPLDPSTLWVLGWWYFAWQPKWLNDEKVLVGGRQQKTIWPTRFFLCRSSFLWSQSNQFRSDGFKDHHYIWTKNEKNVHLPPLGSRHQMLLCGDVCCLLNILAEKKYWYMDLNTY